MATKRTLSQVSPSASASAQLSKKPEMEGNSATVKQIQEMMTEMREMKEDILRGQSIAVTSICEEFKSILQDETGKLKSEIDGELTEIRTSLSTVSDMSENNKLLLDALTQRIAFLEEGNDVLKKCQIDSENQNKLSNLVLLGVPETVKDEDLKDYFLQTVCREKLNLTKDILIKRIHRVGVKGDMKVRNVVVKFLCFPDCELVWNNQRMLKGSKLFLDEHFAIEVQMQRKLLLPFLMAARKRGEKCFLQGGTLVISGRRYSTSTMDLQSLQLRYEDNLRASSQHETADNHGNTVLGFYGKGSMLSNFAPVEFEVNGQKFQSVEQFYSYKKCELNNRRDLAFRVMKADQPLQTTIIPKN